MAGDTAVSVTAAAGEVSALLLMPPVAAVMRKSQEARRVATRVARRVARARRKTETTARAIRTRRIKSPKIRSKSTATV